MAVLVFSYLVLLTPIHEYGHHWTATALGVDTYIEGGRTFWKNGVSGVPQWKIDAIALAGGFLSAAVFGVLFIVARPPYRAGFYPLIVSGLAYAPLDGTETGHIVAGVTLLLSWGWIIWLTLQDVPRPVRRVRRFV